MTELCWTLRGQPADRLQVARAVHRGAQTTRSGSSTTPSGRMTR